MTANPQFADRIEAATALQSTALPTAWADMKAVGDSVGLAWEKGVFHMTPLYTATPAQDDGWRSIDSAPEGKVVVVGWLDHDDPENPERTQFDCKQDGVWMDHAEHVEWAESVAPPGSRMPPTEPPYLYWLDVPPIAATPATGREPE